MPVSIGVYDITNPMRTTHLPGIASKTPFYHCHRTWIDGAVVLRKDLIEISTRWKAVSFAEPHVHVGLMCHPWKQLGAFMAAQDLKQRLVNYSGTPSDW